MTETTNPTPRALTDFKVNPLNDKLTVLVTDEPGAGGANHRYEITGFDAHANGSVEHASEAHRVVILFQNGPVPEHGVNGITQEVLIAIVLDRLRAFQRGSYACRENALAITKLEEAMHWLQHRTRARMARGVEGTSEK